LDMRNKHVAHSVNPFEQVAIGVVLAAPPEPREIKGSAMLRASHVGMVGGAHQLGLLASRLKLHLAKNAERLTEAVVEDARTQLGFDDLYARQPMQIVAPGPEQASRART